MKIRLIKNDNGLFEIQKEFDKPWYHGETIESWTPIFMTMSENRARFIYDKLKAKSERYQELQEDKMYED